MISDIAKFRTVDEYILACPEEIQPTLNKLRNVIKKAAPKAEEGISYGMPFYEYGGKGFTGRLVYFAAFKKHVSLFISLRKNESIPVELQAFHSSKATYQFPNNTPLPFTIIEKAIKALVKSRSFLIEPGKISKEILAYHKRQKETDKIICDLLCREISSGLPLATSKVWHGHPVWFLDDNPIVGYSKQKKGIRLLFWSGKSFKEKGLAVEGEKFQDASIFYTDISEINTRDLKRWLKKSIKIQWDYKNIVKKKGKLERLN